MSEQICFRLQVRPELLDEYVAEHRAVWPEMLAAIARSGRRNYSLFLDRERAVVVGYYETDDDAESARRLAADPVTARWEATMARFFVDLGGRADQHAEHLEQVFRLENRRAKD